MSIFVLCYFLYQNENGRLTILPLLLTRSDQSKAKTATIPQNNSKLYFFS